MFQPDARRRHFRNWRRAARRTQREILCEVMLLAADYKAWLTLKELARLTRFGEASISAQLRHLRKPACGGFVVEKRLRDRACGVRPEQAGALWEYRLRRKTARRRRSYARKT